MIKNKNFYFLKFISICAKIFNPFLKKYEDFKIKNAKKKIEYFPIYIVGAPRTGSTILYQFLTNYFDALYPNNITNRLYRTFYLSFNVNNFFFKSKSHNSFSSRHGNTSKDGLNAPSECSGFWYRWLPKDRHYVLPNEIDNNSIKEIRDNILAVSSKYKKHLIFKNLNNGQRLKLLKEIHPESRIIFIKRNPFFTIQSILKSRKKDNVKEGNMWSVFPKSKNELEQLPEIEMVVKQVFEIEKEIYNSLEDYPESQKIIIKYENFCEDPKKFLEKIENKLFNERINKRNTTNLLKDIKLSNQVSVSKTVEAEIKNQMKLLEWK